jgi:hypothetical protein
MFFSSQTLNEVFFHGDSKFSMHDNRKTLLNLNPLSQWIELNKHTHTHWFRVWRACIGFIGFGLSTKIKKSGHLRATLDEGPRSRVQWNRAIILDESHKLAPWPLDEGPRPKSGKIKAIPTWHNSGGKINRFRPKTKKELKRRAHDWRTKLQARVQDGVGLEDSICFKWVQIGS